MQSIQKLSKNNKFLANITPMLWHAMHRHIKSTISILTETSNNNLFKKKEKQSKNHDSAKCLVTLHDTLKLIVLQKQIL
jgi:hypothetical protein